jgi:hypothetical protein
MNMKSAILVLLLSLIALDPVCAQAVAPGNGDAQTTAATTQTAPAPPRNIMPLGLNHKPNATNPPAEIARSIDLFFKTLRGDGGAAANAPDFYAKAYDTFFNGTALGAQKEKMSIFVSKTQEAFGLYGPLKDYEVFDNYSIGSNVLVLTYLTRHSMQPLRWRFIYYRPDKTWTLINMGFDDVLLDMLD